MKTLVTEVVGDRDAFAALQEEWDRLVATGGTRDFFCRHAFMMANFDRYRDDPRIRLHVVLFRKGGRLVAAAPMVWRRDLLGTGVLRWLDSQTPLYSSLPCVPECEDEVYSAFRKHLHRLPLARKLKVDFVRETSSLARFLRQQGAKWTRTTSVFGLELDGEGVEARLSGQRRSGLGRLRRRLAEAGEVEQAYVTDAQALGELTRWIFLHKREWVLRRYNVANWLCEPATERYFVSVAMQLAAEKRAWGTTLKLDGRPIAAFLWFRDGETAFWSKGAYDPAFHGYSPGWMGMLGSFATAWAHGVKDCDLMIGAGDLKQRLATVRDTVSHYRLRLPVLRGLFGGPR